MASSWISRPKAFVKPEPTGLRAPMSLLPSGAALVADFWEGNVISQPALVLQHLDAAWIRGGQGMRVDTGYKTTSAIFKGQKPRGMYWVYDARVSKDNHVAAIMNTMDMDSELALWIDVELSIFLKTAANYWDDLSNILGRLTVNLGYRPVIYTGMWWWQPNMYQAGKGVSGYPDWQSEFKFALAEYPYSMDGVVCSWETLKANWLPTVRYPRLACGITQSQVVDWQFTGDKFILPGIVNQQGLPNKLDLNYVYDLNRVLVNPKPVPVMNDHDMVATMWAKGKTEGWW